MITLNYRDSKPIYEQIKDGIRRLIFSGVLAEGERLPSVRELAAEQSINPNTIQRAYRELEAEGCLCSVPGKGSFVGQVSELLDTKRAQLFHALDEAVAQLVAAGVPYDEICSHVAAGKEGVQA